MSKVFSRALALISFVLFASVAFAQQKTVSGNVVDQTGQPLIGVNVTVKGTTQGMITDLDGNYSLSVSPNATLVFSYIGYNTQEIRVGNQTTINVRLIESSEMIDEVVVVGYGTQAKVNLTGSVAAVSEKELADRPLTTVSAGIQGLAPGVTALSDSGKPGDGASFQIRGKGTLNNSDPYILVDGIETGTIDELDPNDIESISILKDAASAAIYGSKAANGVILITTKRGKEGKAVVSYNGSYGWQSPTALLDLMSSADYATLYNEAMLREGKTPKYTEEDIRLFRDGTDPDGHPNTDWVDMAFQTGTLQKHSVSINGGSNNMKYMTSAGYLKQKGIMRNSDREQFNMRTNLDIQVSKNVEVRTNLAYIHNDKSEPISSYSPDNLAGGITHQLFRVAPWIPYKYTDGTYGYIGDGNVISWLDINERMRYNDQNFTGSLAADWKIIDGLKLTGQFAYVSNTQNSKRFVKEIYYRPGISDAHHGPDDLIERVNQWYRASFEAYLNYEKRFGKHNLKALAGYKAEKYHYQYLRGRRNTFPNSLLTDLSAGASSTQTNEGNSRDLRLMSFFGRINYDFMGKYLFEANLRADASSRFSSKNRWGYFPSFSIGWRLTEEGFMKDQDFFQNLKLRASWGELGNQDALSDYYPALVSYAITGNYPFGGSLNTGVTKTAHKLSSIGWETTTNVGVGLDANFLKYFNLSVDYYVRTTRDIIMDMPVPGTFGFSAYKDNIGKVRNSGVEVSFGYNQKLNSDWTVGASANFAYNKNEILDLGGVDEMIDSYFINRIGQPYHAYYGYVVEGLFQSDQEADQYTQTYGNPIGRKFKAGDFKFKDVNGDGKLTTADRDIIGNRFPKFTFGGKLNASWKNIDASVMFQGVIKVSRYFTETTTGDFTGDTSHPSTAWLDCWTPSNPNGKWPRPAEGKSSSTHPTIYSSFWCVNTNYLRIKNIQVGYNFPKSLVNSIGLTRARIYFSGENLFTFDNLDLKIDPEMPDGNAYIYPNVKTVSFGINLTF